MAQEAAPAVQEQQARGVAIGERLLRDTLGRQFVVESVDPQNSFFWGAPALSGDGRPKCSNARRVATRPRGVRSRKPI